MKKELARSKNNLAWRTKKLAIRQNKLGRKETSDNVEDVSKKQKEN